LANTNCCRRRCCVDGRARGSRQVLDCGDGVCEVTALDSEVCQQYLSIDTHTRSWITSGCNSSRRKKISEPSHWSRIGPLVGWIVVQRNAAVRLQRRNQVVSLRSSTIGAVVQRPEGGASSRDCRAATRRRKLTPAPA